MDTPTVHLEERDLGERYTLAVVAWHDEDGVRFYVAARPGLDAEEATGLAAWLTDRIQMYFEIGPVRDGWFPRSDGGHQIHGVEVRMDPSLADL